MPAIPPFHSALVHQAQIGLVDQRGGLQRIAGVLESQPRARLVVELAVEHFEQPLPRTGVAAAPGTKQRRQVAAARDETVAAHGPRVSRQQFAEKRDLSSGACEGLGGSWTTAWGALRKDPGAGPCARRFRQR